MLFHSPIQLNVIPLVVDGPITGSGGNYGGTNSFSPFFCTCNVEIQVGDQIDLRIASAAVTTIKVHSGTIKLIGSTLVSTP